MGQRRPGPQPYRLHPEKDGEAIRQDAHHPANPTLAGILAETPAGGRRGTLMPSTIDAVSLLPAVLGDAPAPPHHELLPAWARALVESLTVKNVRTIKAALLKTGAA